MPRRQQVQLGLQEPQIAPAAAPVNQYYHPSLPAPLMKHVIDLAPLSGTLSKIADAQQKKQADRDQAAGKKLYQSLDKTKLDDLAKAEGDLTDVEQGRKDNQREWSKLVAKGIVPESASPWTRVGFMETASADLMNGYHTRLMARMDEVAAATDAQGNPLMPGDHKRLIDDEWKKIAKHPIFQDFYGGRVAADMKQKIDTEFGIRAGSAQGDAQAEFRRAQVVNNLKSVMAGWTVSGDPWTPDQYAQLDAAVDNQMHLRSMKDVQGAIMAAVEFVAAHENETDPQSAVAFLENAKRIKSGTTTIGEDARTGTKLSDLKKQYEAEADRREQKDRANRINQENDTVRDAVTQGLQVISQADKNGEDSVAAINTFITEARSKNSYGALTGRVVASLQEIAAARVDQSVPGVSEDFHRRAALGDTQGIVEEAQALLKSHSLSVKDYNLIVADVKGRSDITPLLEGNDAFVAQRASLNRAMTSTNIPTELRADLDGLAAEKEAAFTQDAAAYAKTVVGNPEAKDLMRTWAVERSTKDKAEYAIQEKALSDQRVSLTSAIRAKLMRHEPAELEIESALNSKAITLSEAGDFQAANSMSSDWTWYKSRSEFKEAEIDIQSAALQAVTDNFGKPGESQAQLGDMLSLAKRKLDDRYSAWLTENLPGIATPQIAGKSREALREITDEVIKDLGNTARDRAKRLAASGKPIGEAVVEGQEEPKQAASAYESVAAGFGAAGRPAFRQTLDVGRNAIVSADIYSKLDGLTLDTWFHTRRPGVEDSVLEEAQRLTKSAAAPEDVQVALHSMAKDLVVPWRDAVAGKLAIYPSGEGLVYKVGLFGARTGDEGLIDALRAADAEARRAGVRLSGDLIPGIGVPDSMTSPAGLEELNRRALSGSQLSTAVSKAIGKLQLARAEKAVKVDFDPRLVDPMTTPFFYSQAELDAWVGDGNLNAPQIQLLNTLGRPATKPSLEEFYKAQTLAVHRTNPDAPVVTKEKK